MPTPELPDLVGDGGIVFEYLPSRGPFTFGAGIEPNGPVTYVEIPPPAKPVTGINFVIPVLNDSAPSTPVALEVESAAYSPVGDVYGRARVLGRLLKIKVNDRFVSLAYLFCVGEVEQVEKLIIDGREADVSANSGGAKFTNADLLLGTASNGQTLYCQVFKGTSGQDVSTFWTNNDGGWSARDSAQTDTWANYCVVCFDLSADLADFRAIPRVEAIIQGHNVRDPRTSPETTAYSNNAALVLAHFYENYVDSSKTVDDTSLAAAADWADEAMTDGSARRTINTWLNKRQTVENIGASMATWCGIYVSTDEDAFYFIPDRERNSDLDLGPSRVISATAKRRSDSERPDDVRVIGFDVDNNREYIAEALGSGSKITELRIPGITNYAEAKRYAIQHYNHATTEDLEISCKVFGVGLKLLRGNVVRFTSDALAIQDKAMRVSEVEFDGTDGHFVLRLTEYQAASYSDDISTDPISTDLTIGDPFDVPSLSKLSGLGGYNQTSAGTDQAYIDVSWNSITFLFAAFVELKVYDISTSPEELARVIVIPAGSTATRIDGLSTNTNYRVEGRIQSTTGTFGSSSAFATSTSGDTTAPAAPTNFGNVLAQSSFETRFNAGGWQLEWAANTESDLLHYKLYVYDDASPENVFTRTGITTNQFFYRNSPGSSEPRYPARFELTAIDTSLNESTAAVYAPASQGFWNSSDTTGTITLSESDSVATVTSGNSATVAADQYLQVDSPDYLAQRVVFVIRSDGGGVIDLGVNLNHTASDFTDFTSSTGSALMLSDVNSTIAVSAGDVVEIYFVTQNFFGDFNNDAYFYINGVYIGEAGNIFNGVGNSRALAPYMDIDNSGGSGSAVVRIVYSAEDQAGNVYNGF